MSLFRRIHQWLGGQAGFGDQRVLWTLRGRRGLHRNPLVSNAPGSLSQERLDQMLAATFPGRDVIVHDALFGFRVRRNHQILLVEAVSPNDDLCGSFVTKVGPAERIRDEWQSWERCRPPGPHHDPVFQPLRRGHPVDGWDEPFATIVYGDALQFIGVDEVCTGMTLEDAVLDSIRFNSPDIGSVLVTLEQLFARAGQVLYRRGRPTDPSTPFSPPGKRLLEALDQWEQSANLRNLRSYADTRITRLERPDNRLPVRRYLGPVPYLRYVLEVASRDPERLSQQGLPAARKEDVIPTLLQGPAHGDLHGRNVLVGVEREQVRWPAVFDYDSMGPDNYIGLDFVKLETELKVRAYPALFDRLNKEEYTRAVHDFEWRLALQTEQSDFPRECPSGAEKKDQLERLRAVVLKIRQQAAEYLDYPRARGRWLEEYYFLLCCYGVVPPMYGTYSERNLTAALLSAGVATARLQWPLQRFDREMRLVQTLAS